jgi:hypothetical protein
MRRLIALETWSIYGQDGKSLEAANEKAGLDVFVGHVMILDRKDLEPTSLSVLTRGVQTLLPRTDAVAFMDLDEGKEPRAVVTFEDALRALGPRAVLRPGYPPRWMVTELPSNEELARLPRMPGF